MAHVSEFANPTTFICCKHHKRLHTMKLLFLLAAICVVALAQNCPSVSDDDLDLQDSEDKNSAKRIPTDGYKENPLDMLEKDNCADPEDPDDNPDLQTATPKTTRGKRASLRPAVWWRRTCEPCPPRVHHLYRFYKTCYVIAYKQQQVRYVTCPKRCIQPCMCGGSYCQRTDRARIWFFSYCFGPTTQLQGGFHFGFNYRYLWLAQDCTCRNV